MGVVTNVAGRPAEKALSYDVSTTEKTQKMSTPRYGTHAHKSRWKISPWLLTTVSSSLSRSSIAHGRSAERGRGRVSLVPRPFGGGEKKRPGIH